MTTTEPERERGVADQRLPRSTWRWIRLAAILASVWLAYQELRIVQSWALALLGVLLYVAFGGVLALVAFPAVAGLRARGVPSPLAIGIVVAGGLAAIAALAYWVGLNLLSELHGFALRVPGWVSGLEHLYRRTLEPALRASGLNPDPSAALAQIAGPDALAGSLPQLVLTAVSSSVQVAADALIVLVVSVWLLADGPRLRDALADWLPARERAVFSFAVDAVVVVFGGYVRAQLLMALLIGVLAGVGCALLGVPFPLVIGVVAAVFELIPIVGPFAGGAVALLLAATVSWWLVLWTLLLFLGIHAVEGYVLAPRIQARFVRIPPLIAFLALLAGIEVGGFIGALFAVPVASLLAVLTRALIAAHRRLRPERWRESDADQLLAEERRRLDEFSLLGRTGRPPPWEAVARRLGSLSRGGGPKPWRRA